MTPDTAQQRLDSKNIETVQTPRCNKHGMTSLTGINNSGVPTPPGKSSNYFCKICRTLEVLESDFGPGKSWKFKLKSPGKYWNLLACGHIDSDTNVMCK